MFSTFSLPHLDARAVRFCASPLDESTLGIVLRLIVTIIAIITAAITSTITVSPDAMALLPLRTIATRAGYEPWVCGEKGLNRNQISGRSLLLALAPFTGPASPAPAHSVPGLHRPGARTVSQ